MNAEDANPGLHDLVQRLTEAGYRLDLRPIGEMDDGTSRKVYYGVRVSLDGLTPTQLNHLTAIVDGSPYDGRVNNGELVLEAARR